MIRVIESWNPDGVCIVSEHDGEASREMMWTAGILKDGDATDYGLCWKIADYEGVKEVTHGGAQQRVSTFLYLCPKKGLAVAVLGDVDAFDSLVFAGLSF